MEVPPAIASVTTAGPQLSDRAKAAMKGDDGFFQALVAKLTGEQVSL